MKITKKQKRKLLLLDYFIPEHLRGGKLETMGNNTEKVKESENGQNSEEAFMDYQSKGIIPKEVDNLHRFNQLKYSQMRMAMMEKMWREMIEEEVTFIWELKDKEEMNEFVSEEQYQEFCKWIDKTYKTIQNKVLKRMREQERQK